MQGLRLLFVLSSLAFLLALAACEEQFPQTLVYEQSYTLEQGNDAVLRALNALEQEAELGNPYFSLRTERANHFDNYFGTRLYFRHGGEDIVYDTIKVVDERGKPVPGDPYDLVQRRVTLLDTHYLNPDGFFRFHLPSPSDSGRCDEVYALLRLSEKANGSELLLDRIRIDGCKADFRMNDGESPKERVLKDFETIVLKALQ